MNLSPLNAHHVEPDPKLAIKKIVSLKDFNSATTRVRTYLEKSFREIRERNERRIVNNIEVPFYFHTVPSRTILNRVMESRKILHTHPLHGNPGAWISNRLELRYGIYGVGLPKRLDQKVSSQNTTHGASKASVVTRSSLLNDHRINWLGFTEDLHFPEGFCVIVPDKEVSIQKHFNAIHQSLARKKESTEGEEEQIDKQLMRHAEMVPFSQQMLEIALVQDLAPGGGRPPEPVAVSSDNKVKVCPNYGWGN